METPSTSRSHWFDSSLWEILRRDRYSSLPENLPENLPGTTSQPSVAANVDDVAVAWDPLQEATEKWRLLRVADTGWDRVKQAWTRKYECGFRSLEVDALAKVISLTFKISFLYGGIRQHGRMVERFKTHNALVMYKGVREAMRRQVDFTIVMFMKNGLLFGCKVATLVGLSFGAVSMLSVYRDKFALYYIPLSAGLAGSVYTINRGPKVMLMAGCLAACLSTVFICAPLAAVSLHRGKSLDEIYKQSRQEYYDDFREQSARTALIETIMEEQNLWFRYQAERILEEKEAAAASADPSHNTPQVVSEKV
uniref:Complex I assembly factor TIMMDC1, mitochondrial n=1 Tax=Plectus sambesii TaxID=2011161 RepID=A0A914WVL0_9BILA